MPKSSRTFNAFVSPDTHSGGNDLVNGSSLLSVGRENISLFAYYHYSSMELVWNTMLRTANIPKIALYRYHYYTVQCLFPLGPRPPSRFKSGSWHLQYEVKLAPSIGAFLMLICSCSSVLGMVDMKTRTGHMARL